MKRLLLWCMIVFTGVPAVISGAAAGVPAFRPDITVAQDGSGEFRTIQAAIDSVPA